MSMLILLLSSIKLQNVFVKKVLETCSTFKTIRRNEAITHSTRYIFYAHPLRLGEVNEPRNPERRFSLSLSSSIYVRASTTTSSLCCHLLLASVNGRNRFSPLVTLFIDILFRLHLDCVKEYWMTDRSMHEWIMEIRLQIARRMRQGSVSGADACDFGQPNKLSGMFNKKRLQAGKNAVMLHFLSGIFGEVSPRWLFFHNNFIAHVQRTTELSCLFSNVMRRKKPAGDKGN